MHVVDNKCTKNRQGGGRLGPDGCGMNNNRGKVRGQTGRRTKSYMSTERLTLFLQRHQLRCHYMTTNTQASPVNVSKCLLYSLEYTCNRRGGIIVMWQDRGG